MTVARVAPRDGFVWRAAVVVGNPRAGGRTTEVALTTARAIVERVGGSVPGDDAVSTIELSHLGAALFTWGDPEVAAAKQVVLASNLLIVASPVYKASFTALLKAFLDQFGTDELAGLATVPVMVGGGAAHTLAVEQQLRPVLVEIGASCPTRGVFVQDQQLDALPGQLAAWLDVWAGALFGVVSAPRP